MIRSFFSLCLFLFGAVLLFQLGAEWVLKPILLRHTHDDTKHLSKGLVFLIRERLNDLTPDERMAEIQALRPHFGFDISLLPLKDSLFSEEARTSLTRGLVTITPLDRLGEDLSVNVPFLDSDQVVVLGPLTHLAEFSRLTGMLDMTAIGVVILGLLGWIAMLRHRFLRLSRAVERLGQGDLAARASITGRDLTAKLGQSFDRMAERIQQLIEGQKHLTNAVSHELRTPIARLRFGVEMIRECEDVASKLRYLKGMDLDVAELDALVEELLAYARLDRVPTDPELIVRPLVPWLRDLVSQWPSDKEVFFQPEHVDEALEVGFHEEYLHRAVTNLLRNAMRHGALQAHISVETHDDSLELHVDDDGPGIPPQWRERLFEPFVRMDASRDRRLGGAGLGLAIVKRIASWHGGTAKIEDSPLGGTRVTLTWPIVPNR